MLDTCDAIEPVLYAAENYDGPIVDHTRAAAYARVRRLAIAALRGGVPLQFGWTEDARSAPTHSHSLDLHDPVLRRNRFIDITVCNLQDPNSTITSRAFIDGYLDHAWQRIQHLRDGLGREHLVILRTSTPQAFALGRPTCLRRGLFLQASQHHALNRAALKLVQHRMLELAPHSIRYRLVAELPR
jgi:hypothetical protein